MPRSYIPYCNPCNREFFSQEILAQHNFAFHQVARGRQRGNQVFNPPAARVYCEQCNREFFSEQSLEQHYFAVHAIAPVTHGRNQAFFSGGPPFCNLCNREFVSEDAFAQHYEAVHTIAPVAHGGNQVFTPAGQAYCNHCSRAFFSQEALEQHNSAVHQFAPVAHRGNQSSSNGVLQVRHDMVGQYLSIQSPSPFHGRANPASTPPRLFPCRQCTSLFNSNEFLNQHIATMHQGPRHNPAPVSTLPCGICGIGFSTQYILDQHQALMHPVVPGARNRNTATRNAEVSCTICRKPFVNEYALDQHMVSNAHPEYVQNGRTRAPAPVFKCDECPRTFNVKDMLTMHAASHAKQRLGR